MRASLGLVGLAGCVIGSLVIFVVLSGAPSAQDADAGAEPVNQVSESFAAVDGQVSATAMDKAKSLADWMVANEWQQLSLTDRVALMRGLALRGRADDIVSVRWTGSVIAPGSGDYQFVMHYNDYYRGFCRLWIDNQLVVEATDFGDIQGGQLSFISTAVSLTQGTAVPIKVEFAHYPEASMPSIADPANAQTVTTLLWQSNNLPRQLVPPSAYVPPEGFAPSGATGIKGEYFSDKEFQQSLFTRLDSAIDLMTVSVSTTEYLTHYRDVRDDCFQTLLDPEFLASVSGDLAENYWANPVIADTLEYATTWQRAQYANWLLSHPDVLAADPGLFGDVFARLVTVPRDYRVQLLRTWAADRSLRALQIGFYPDQYTARNASYESLGHWFQEPLADDLIALATNHLKRADGSCRVELLRVLAYGAVNGKQSGWLRQQLLEQQEEIPFNSDARASWLLALAAMEEVAGGPPVRPNLAMPALTEARLIAQSNEMRFQILGQLVPRLISLGKFSDARSVLMTYASELQGAEQQADIQQWQSEADQLETQWDQFVQERYAAQKQSQAENRVAMLQQRLTRAERRGDAALAARYRDLIDQVNLQN